MMNIIIKILLIYILYQFIFRIVIPGVKAYKQIQKHKQKIKDHYSYTTKEKKRPSQSSKKIYGEYIEYEEVKTKKK